jgi:hypothetical protein
MELAEFRSKTLREFSEEPIFLEDLWGEEFLLQRQRVISIFGPSSVKVVIPNAYNQRGDSLRYANQIDKRLVALESNSREIFWLNAKKLVIIDKAYVEASSEPDVITKLYLKMPLKLTLKIFDVLFILIVKRETRATVLSRLPKDEIKYAMFALDENEKLEEPENFPSIQSQRKIVSDFLSSDDQVKRKNKD